jgi:hypothetical protein
MRRSLPTFLALALLALPTAGLAQEHAAPPETLDAIAVSHAAGLEAERAELRAFLERPEVRRVAEESGLEVLTADAAVASLGERELASLAPPLAQAEAALAGGDSIVISTTAIIIALLVLIIILVA